LLGAAGTAGAAEPYDIHVVESLTGYAAFLGTQENDALELEANTVNATGGIHGRPVHFIHHDDQSSPQLAVQLVNGLIPANPPVILGPTLVPSCGATQPLILKAGPVMYCFGSGIRPPPGSFGFSGGVGTVDQMQVLIRFLRLKGWTRIAFISTTDATGQDGDKSLEQAMALPENAGVKLVEHTHFNVSDVSVAAQLERIRAADAQTVIVWTIGSATGSVFRGLIQGGIELPVGTDAGNMTYSQMKQFATILPKECYFSSPSWPAAGDARIKLVPGVAAKQKEFYAAYATHKDKPDEGSMLAWDAATTIIDALRALPDPATAAQLHDHMISAQAQPGVGGTYNFVAVPQRGLSQDDVMVSRWDVGSDRWIAVTQPGGVLLEN
jgi:branched-chain amino acid transport system substrate-binding protein